MRQREMVLGRLTMCCSESQEMETQYNHKKPTKNNKLTFTTWSSIQFHHLSLADPQLQIFSPTLDPDKTGKPA